MRGLAGSQWSFKSPSCVGSEAPAVAWPSRRSPSRPSRRRRPVAEPGWRGMAGGTCARRGRGRSSPGRGRQRLRRPGRRAGADGAAGAGGGRARRRRRRRRHRTVRSFAAARVPPERDEPRRGRRDRHDRRRRRFAPRAFARRRPVVGPASRVTPTSVDGGRRAGARRSRTCAPSPRSASPRASSSTRRQRVQRAGRLAPPARAQPREDRGAPLVGEGSERLGHVGGGREARVEVALQRPVHRPRRAPRAGRGECAPSGSGSVVKILKRISVYSPESAVYGVRPESIS